MAKFLLEIQISSSFWNENKLLLGVCLSYILEEVEEKKIFLWRKSNCFQYYILNLVLCVT